jgi:hypothetical protein
VTACPWMEGGSGEEGEGRSVVPGRLMEGVRACLAKHWRACAQSKRAGVRVSSAAATFSDAAVCNARSRRRACNVCGRGCRGPGVQRRMPGLQAARKRGDAVRPLPPCAHVTAGDSPMSSPC